MASTKQKKVTQPRINALLIIIGSCLFALLVVTGFYTLLKYRHYQSDALTTPLAKTKQIQQSFDDIFNSILKQSNNQIGKWTLQKSRDPQHSALIYTLQANQKKYMLPLQTLIKKTYQLSYNNINKVTVFDTRTGDVLATPSDEFVLTKTIQHLIPGTEKQINKMVKTQHLLLTTAKNIRRDYHVAFLPIKQTPYALAISFRKKPITKSLIQFNRIFHLFLIQLAFFLLVLLIYLHRRYEWPHAIAWLIAIGFTLFSIFTIILIILNSYNISIEQTFKESPPILNQFKLSDPNEKNTIAIGIQIYSLSPAIDSLSNSIQTGGVLWELMPTQQSSQSPSVHFINKTHRTDYQKISEVKFGRKKIVKWWFESSFSADENSHQFPFADENMRIYFVPNEKLTHKQIMPLVDDYTDLDPSRLPGIHKLLTLNNYSITKTYFSRQNIHLDYNYDHSTPLKSDLPSLEYNILLRPYITPILLTYILPCIVIYMMLFCYLMFLNRKKTESNDFRSDLIYFSALFITLAITNASFISSAGTKTLTYLDFFFVLGYILVLATTAIGAYFNSDRQNARCQQRLQNIRLAFWPMVLTVLMVFSYVWLG